MTSLVEILFPHLSPAKLFGATSKTHNKNSVSFFFLSDQMLGGLMINLSASSIWIPMFQCLFCLSESEYITVEIVKI